MTTTFKKEKEAIKCIAELLEITEEEANRRVKALGIMLYYEHIRGSNILVFNNKDGLQQVTFE